MRLSPARLLVAALALAAALLAPSAVLAQGPVAPENILAANTALLVQWDAPAVSVDGLDAPASYKVETFRETATGVTVTTYTVAASATQLEVPATTLPTGAFLLATRAVNAAGESARSNVAGPFGIGTAPKAPTRTRAAVVPAR